MALMTDSEKASAVSDVRKLIESSGQDAVLLRSVSSEKLYGSDDEEFARVYTFKLEFVPTPQEDIANSVDATANVLPDLDVRVQDRIHIGGDKYRVQTIVEESLFGVMTHKTLKLVQLHGC